MTRTSRRPSPVLYEVYAQCANEACGWGGKLYIEFAKTFQLSRAPDAGVSIPMPLAVRRQTLDQLAALNG
ncbi:hypothetical protein BTW07_05600 [Salinicola socius]|uniref:Zinc finger Ogr/Delta-type domain-containing protein n=2 Tax=Salinicola socius TaxID=404433 RepID=A0A1Q8SUL7_9GAMM|nr:hypothetical protein BTW07_05600 [Salinicola socius]